MQEFRRTTEYGKMSPDKVILMIFRFSFLIKGEKTRFYIGVSQNRKIKHRNILTC